MDFLLLWIECAALLLLWMALAVALDASLPRGTRRWVTVAGLTCVAVVSGFELVATLGVAVALKLPFAIFFVSSLAITFLIGSGLLCWRGLRAEQPGLAPRAATWPWKYFVLFLLISTGLAATSMHDMRVAAEQEMAKNFGDLRELQHQIDPPVPAALNSAPLYTTAFPHLVVLDAIPGARAAFESLDGAAVPTIAQIFAPPLAEWTKRNSVAVKLLIEAGRLPGYSTLEETVWHTPPALSNSRMQKVANLELNEPRPDSRVVGHLSERKRAANLLQTEALRDAFSGRRALAVDEANAMIALARSSKSGTVYPEATLEKMIAAPGWTDDELSRLDVRVVIPLKTRLQLALISDELNNLTTLSVLLAEPDGFTGPNPRQPLLGRIATDILELGRSLIYVLGTNDLIAHNRQGYDALWKALYAPPQERFSALDAEDNRLGALFDGPQVLRLVIVSRILGEARRACAEAGIAVARYRIQTGHLPQALGDLVPSILLDVPADPFDGKPLRYTRDAETAVIYSIGPDGKDDGGQALSSNQPGDKLTGDIAFHIPPRR